MDASSFFLVLICRPTWLKFAPLPLAEISLDLNKRRSLSVGLQLLAKSVERDREHLKVELACPIGGKTDWFLVVEDVAIEQSVSYLEIKE